MALALIAVVVTLLWILVIRTLAGASGARMFAIPRTAVTPAETVRTDNRD